MYSEREREKMMHVQWEVKREEASLFACSLQSEKKCMYSCNSASRWNVFANHARNKSDRIFLRKKKKKKKKGKKCAIAYSMFYTRSSVCEWYWKFLSALFARTSFLFFFIFIFLFNVASGESIVTESRANALSISMRKNRSLYPRFPRFSQQVKIDRTLLHVEKETYSYS